MMKKIRQIICFSALICFLYSCNDDHSRDHGFGTKDDSIKFATAVFKKYPEDNKLTIGFAGLNSNGDTGMAPITWPTVLEYRKYYDANPLLYSPDGQPYKGFDVDASGYKLLLENTDIAGLYIRLGRRPDGAYTFMVLGTNAAGDLLQDSVSRTLTKGGDNNFDHLDPCPSDCPPNFDNN